MRQTRPSTLSTLSTPQTRPKPKRKALQSVVVCRYGPPSPNSRSRSLNRRQRTLRFALRRSLPTMKRLPSTTATAPSLPPIDAPLLIIGRATTTISATLKPITRRPQAHHHIPRRLRRDTRKTRTLRRVPRRTRHTHTLRSDHAPIPIPNKVRAPKWPRKR